MKRLSVCLGLAIMLALTSGMWVPSIVAQSKSVVVTRRDADITIQPSGDVQVSEIWVVQFSGGPFSSAFRTIPLNRVEDITAWGVTEAGETFRERSSNDPYSFQASEDTRSHTLKWYFTPATNQERTFGVSYTLKGALGIDPIGDELYWKFIERDRPYPIQSATVRVHLPAPFDTGQLQAAAYRDGVAGTGGRIVDGRTVEFTGGPFPGGVGWEVRSKFPHGAVSASPPAWQIAAQTIAPTPVRQAASGQSKSAGGDLTGTILVIGLILIVGFFVWAAIASGGSDPGGWSGGGGSHDWSSHRSGSSWSSRRGGGGSSRRGGGGGGGSSGFG